MLYSGGMCWEANKFLSWCKSALTLVSIQHPAGLVHSAARLGLQSVRTVVQLPPPGAQGRDRAPQKSEMDPGELSSRGISAAVAGQGPVPGERSSVTVQKLCPADGLKALSPFVSSGWVLGDSYLSF